MTEGQNQKVRGALSVQSKLILVFVIFLVCLIFLGSFFYLSVRRSFVQSENLITESTHLFEEIEQITNKANESQQIFDKILIFDSESDEDLFELQASFNAAALEFSLLLNMITLGGDSDEFQLVNYGLDAHLRDRFDVGSVNHDGRHRYSDGDGVYRGHISEDFARQMTQEYDKFIFNVNNSIASHKKYLRIFRSEEYQAQIAAQPLVIVLDEDGGVMPAEVSEDGVITVGGGSSAENLNVGVDGGDPDQEADFVIEKVAPASGYTQEDAQKLLRSAQIFGHRANISRNIIVTDLGQSVKEFRERIFDGIAQEARRQQTLYRNGIYILFVGVLFLVFLTTGLIHILIVYPVKLLTKSAERIIEGDRNVVIPMQERGDEIGFLSRSFYRMVESLIGDAETLEVQVRARTTQLDKKTVELEGYVKEIESVTKNLMRRDVELTKANDRLKEADQAKNEFVSVAAHQLRTPLTAIRWIYEMLSQAKDIPKAHADVIHNGLTATENLISTVNDMLNVARIDEGRMGFDIARHDLAKLLKGILTEFEFDTKHKGLHFESVVPDGEIVFDFDWEKLDMMIRNLLSNAVKYTEVGGIVRLGVVIKDEKIMIIVADNGIGIPKKQQPRIFSKFFRADNALLHQTNGSGLGLYVTRDIVEKHKGTIILESEEGKGTTFTVTLPYKKSDSSDV